ncbi:MAG: DUF4349 domain-containing protein [Propionibacteriaceae bacterium]|jgi:hypothetical protein|nr:DUF4349 domain-containing protein [Propionibacteriaceae bacterium]
MNLRLRRGWVAALALGLSAGLLLLGGCSGGGYESTDRDPYPQYPDYNDGVNPDDNYPAPGELGPKLERQIARTATVNIVVDDVKSAADHLHELAARYDGWVMKESISIPENDTSSGWATIQISIPADSLDAVLDDIDAIGTVTKREIEAEDVTDRLVDTESRITTMRQSIARLQELMAKSGSVTEIANVERELTQRQADLEALLAVMANLEQRVATSTISISVSTPYTPPVKTTGTFLSGLKAGWEAMVTAAAYLVIVIGALLPWAAFAALIVVPILLVRRNRRAKGLIPPKKPRVPAYWLPPQPAPAAPGQPPVGPTPPQAPPAPPAPATTGGLISTSTPAPDTKGDSPKAKKD